MARLTDDERAKIRADCSDLRRYTLLVEKREMLALLDERDELAAEVERLREQTVSRVRQGAWGSPW